MSLLVSKEEGEFKLETNEHKDANVIEEMSCDQCGKTYSNRDVFLKHKRSHWEKFTCNICEKVFNRKDTLKKHSLIHGPRQIKCNICKQEFTNLKDKYSHMEGAHGKPLKKHYSPEFKVDAVKRIKEIGLLEASKELGVGESTLSEWQRFVFNPLYCSFCGKSFARESFLKLHEERVHNGNDDENAHANGKNKNDEYQCNKCSKSFILLPMLHRHMVKCGNSPDIVCNICQRKFARRKGLREHIRFIHEKERGFCCEYCSKTFARSNTLTQHVKDVHEQSGNFACSFCDKKYFKMRDKIVHERKHTGEKPFQCGTCGERCSRYKAKKTEFKCEKCNGVLMKVLQIVTNPEHTENQCDEKEVMNQDYNMPQATTDRESANTGLRELYKQKYDTDEEIGQIDLEEIVKAEMIESSDTEKLEHDQRAQKVKGEMINCSNQIVPRDNFEKNEDKLVSIESKLESKAEEMIDELVQNSYDEEMFDESYFVQTMKESDDSFEPKDSKEEVQNTIDDSAHLIKEEIKEDYGETGTKDSLEIEKDEENRIKCHLCQTTFSRKKGLMQHIRFVHQQEKNFCCEFCTKRFARKNSLTTHVKDIHEQSGNFSCQFCEKKFFKERDMKRHQSKHSSEKPYQCDNCGESFKRQYNLLEHLKSHLGLQARNFQCVDCGKQFGTKGTLQRHVQSLHVNEFPCSLCDEKFQNNRLMKLHMKFHSGVRAFTCYDCGRQFRSNESLKNHAFSVHINEPCKLCDNQINDELHLTEHLKSEARKNKPKRQKKQH